MEFLKPYYSIVWNRSHLVLVKFRLVQCRFVAVTVNTFMGVIFFWTTCMLIPSDVEVQNLARWEKFCGLNWIGSTIGALAACHVLRNLTCRMHVERGKFFAGRTELLPCHECLWPQKNCTGGTLVQWCFNWRTGVLVPAAEYGLTAIHNTQLTAICHDNPGKPYQNVSSSGFYWS